MTTSPTTSQFPNFIDPQSPIFNEPESPTRAPQRWHDCRKFAREQRRCSGCGKKIKASRIRCHNLYMCNNCGSGKTLAWVWLKKRDPSILKSVSHTGIELFLPDDPTLSRRVNESRLLALRQSLVDELGVSEVYMPRISQNRVRLSLSDSIRRDHIAAAWCRLTNGKGEVTAVHHYQLGGCLLTFFTWIFDGMHSLAVLTETERLATWDEFRGSHRISARGGFYSPLPAVELAVLIAAQKAFKGTDTCDCCGSPMVNVPQDEQTTMPVEEFQKVHAHNDIEWTEDYDPFWVPRAKGLYRPTIYSLPPTSPMPSISPPS